jgi:putative methyltransferase (TIGR04325 family)
MKNLWEGIFKTFAEAGGDLDAFESDIWISKQKDKILSLFAEYEKGNTFSKDYPLPLVVGGLLAHQRKVSVLDFGGGMGMQYLDVLGKVPEAEERVEYVIVDGLATLENTPSFMHKFRNLQYHSDLDHTHRRFDIVHIGSTLQYIENWKSLLERLIQNYTPIYLVFSDLMAGNIPTFVSHQIFYDKNVPHLFLNFEDFKRFLEELGFNIIFKAKFVHKILDQEEIFPNLDLPLRYRLDRSLNVVFQLKTY